jgi:DNA-binding transcriptional regulator YiaG
MSEQNAKLDRFIQSTGEKQALAALIAFVDGHISESAMANVCFPYVQKIATVLSWKYGLSGTLSEDDVTSEIWDSFNKWLIPNFDRDYGAITPLVMKIGSRICLKIKTENSAVVEFLPNADSLDDITEIDDGEIDKNLARAKMAEILYNRRINNPTQTSLERQTLKTEIQIKEKAPINKDSIELLEIKKKLAWTTDRIASELNIPSARMASYLYGKTKTIPSVVLEKARALLLIEADEVEEAKLFAGQSMQQIVKKFAKLAKLKNPTEKEIAIACNVSVATINRWLHGGTRPSDSQLLHYQRIAEMFGKDR